MKIPPIAAAAALLLIGGAAAATTPSGWETLKIPGKAATEFRTAPNGAIKVSATESVGFLYRELPPAQNGVTRISWRWRVDMAPLAIHICFDAPDTPSDRWSLFGQVGKWTRKSPLRGKVLTYVWGGTRNRGELIQNPYLNANGRIIILRPGDSPTGRWFAESVDIDADFERAFGYPPPKVRAIAISADTDDKRGMSMAKVADLKIHAE